MDGGSKINILASNGGSGGGGGSWNPDHSGIDNTTPGISTNILGGNSGGYGIMVTAEYPLGGAGGGGGSGTAGTNGNREGYGGNGGNGTDLFASWISAISSNMDEVWRNVTSQGHIAAGGGGAASSTRIGDGGLGGGGYGGSNHSYFWLGFNDADPTDGITNTGSGGGGAGYVYGNIMKLGGNGCSGLVIIRIPPTPVTTDLKAYFSLNGTTKEIISNNINTIATNVTYDTIGNKTGIVCPDTDTTYNDTSTKYIINYNIPTFSLVASSGVSISVWFYPTVLNTTDKPLFTLDLPESPTWIGLGYTCAVRSNGINMWVANYRSARYAISSTASLNLSTNTWYHLVMLFDTTTNQIQAYLNGSSIAVIPATAIISTISTVSAVDLPMETNRFSIGSASQLTNNFTGLISKFAIYNRVLSSTEINLLYNV